jgi:hypothetical protein
VAAESPGADDPQALPVSRPLQLLGVAALLTGFAALRIAAVSRAAFNWDELALFDGVARTLQDGVLRSGGRPGLTQLLVMPLVEACTDEARVGRLARGLWLLVTTAYLAGVYALLFELLRDRPRRVHDACLGVALLALVPAFLEWSLQVRTDQIALVGAVWGGFALLCSQRQPGLALLAGLLFGIGWLSSQKLAYAAALVGLLAVGRLGVERSFELRREGWRAVLAIAGFGTVLLCFRALAMWLFTLPEAHAARHVLGPPVASAHQHAFPFYRSTIGYSQYAAMLPSLVPHFVLAAGLVLASASAWRRERGIGRLGLAWAVLALGAVVGLYHAAAFAYFWMTLGLFPAVALAIAADEIRERLLAAHPRWLPALTTALWLALLVPAGFSSVLLLRDTQAVQRESLAFVHRNFATDQRGFHPEGGLFCAAPEPSGIWFSQRIYRQFESPARATRAAALESHFRSEPVYYLVESFRLNQFPVELRRFWADNYQPYRGSVFVAGRRLGADGGSEESFELLVPGRYRWLPLGEGHTARIDGRTLEPGQVVELADGAHTAALPPGARGVLVLSLGDPPGRAPLAFYGPS